jgi:hypothetical protein
MDQPPAPPLDDIVAVAMDWQSRRPRSWVPALATAATVLLVSGAAIVLVRTSGDTSQTGHPNRLALSSSSLASPSKESGTPVGCGVLTPPMASTVGYSAVLRPVAGGRQWELTVKNESSAVSTVSSGIDLVATDADGRIIGAAREGPRDIPAVVALAPGQSWSKTLVPVAADCSATSRRGNVAVIPAGTYAFVATIFVGTHYLSSNPVQISVSPDGSFSAA